MQLNLNMIYHLVWYVLIYVFVFSTFQSCFNFKTAFKLWNIVIVF